MSIITFRNTKGELINLRSSPITREKLLMYKLGKFYRKKHRLEKIASILEDKNKIISLRIIEWFVLQYSRKNQVLYPILNSKGQIRNCVYVYQSYKNTLKSFHGKYFSVFSRTDPIIVEYKENNECKKIKITIAQLNFFKWILENNILNFIKKNFNKLASKLYKSKRKFKQQSSNSSALKTKITQHKIKTDTNSSENGVIVEIDWN